MYFLLQLMFLLIYYIKKPLWVQQPYVLRRTLQLELDLRASHLPIEVAPPLKSHVDAVVIDCCVDAIEPGMRGKRTDVRIVERFFLFLRVHASATTPLGRFMLHMEDAGTMLL